jgi:uncharacterized repeat protein (TIGR03803 family)
MTRIANIFVLCAATAIALSAQTFTTLLSFDGVDGEGPSAALVQAANGDFYGTAHYGGAHNDGTVFKITPSGTLTTLHRFCYQGSYPNCSDGSGPWQLVQAANGDFYGTTWLGGVSDFCYYGCGTIFKITPAGTLTTVYSFCTQSVCTAGKGPNELVQATNGDFYGTTDGGVGVGTVFKLSPGGTLTTLHTFCSLPNSADGEMPLAPLVQATNGDFYGTTKFGGANDCGTVFKITPSGTLTTLYSFCSQSGCTDGYYPQAGLVQATNGDFYGTTFEGGTNAVGTVFGLTPSGTLTTLYSFCAQGGSLCTDGAGALAGLVQGTDGNFYGTTYSGGGLGDAGTIFKITPSGTLTTLYSFCSQGGSLCTDGFGPNAALLQSTNGDFYGTTYDGGANCASSDHCGTIFSLSVGLGPFVKILPHANEVGGTIRILGTDLTGTASVSFNGTPAAFSVVVATEITATVPAGATTGQIEVSTPGGTLFSSGPFLVLP